MSINAVLHDITLSPKQLEAKNSPASFVLAGGAAGGGKTFLCLDFILNCIYPNAVIGVFRKERQHFFGNGGFFDVVEKFFTARYHDKYYRIIQTKPEYVDCDNDTLMKLWSDAARAKLPDHHPAQPLSLYKIIRLQSNKSTLMHNFNFQYLIDTQNTRHEYVPNLQAPFCSMHLNDIEDSIIYEDRQHIMQAGWFRKESAKQDILELRASIPAPLNITHVFNAQLRCIHLNNTSPGSSIKESGKAIPYAIVEEIQEISLSYIQDTVLRRNRFETAMLATSPVRLCPKIIATCNPANGDLFNSIKATLLDANNFNKPIIEQCKKVFLMKWGHSQFDLIDPQSTQGQDIIGDNKDLHNIVGYRTFQFIPFTLYDNKDMDPNYLSTLLASNNAEVCTQIIYGGWTFGYNDVLFPRDAFRYYDCQNLDTIQYITSDLDLYIATADFAHKNDGINDKTVIALWGVNFFPPSTTETEVSDTYQIYLIDLLIPKDSKNEASNQYYIIENQIEGFLQKYITQLRKPFYLGHNRLGRSGIIMLEATSHGTTLYSKTLHNYGSFIDVVGWTKSRNHNKMTRAISCSSVVRSGYTFLPSIKKINNLEEMNLVTKINNFLDEVTTFGSTEVGSGHHDDQTDCLMFAIELTQDYFDKYKHLIIKEKQRRIALKLEAQAPEPMTPYKWMLQQGGLENYKKPT